MPTQEKTSRSKAPAARLASPKKAVLEKPSSLSEQAYEAIKERIITLYFLPGQYLNESAISELLNLGRTPVRQALQRLQIEGLVDIVPRKGVIIQPDSIGQILEILDARIVLEAELAKRAAERATDRDVQDLEAALDGGHRRHGGGAIDAFVECDRAFHVKIGDMSGNRVLGDFSKVLHERSTRSWYLHLWQTLDTDGSDRQHRAVLEAVRARDGAGAAEAMRTHLSSLRERVAHIQSAAPRRTMAPLQR